MRPRLLLITLYPSTFVQDDWEILRDRYEVRRFLFAPGLSRSRLARTAGLVALVIRQLAWLARELPRSCVVYGWFADQHMVLPVLLARFWRRPVVVVLGGFDANHLPEYGFGVFHSRWRGPLARIVVRKCTLLLAVTPGLIRSKDRFATWPEPRDNGILAHVPGLRTPYQVLPTGFNAEAWPLGPMSRLPSVCTSAWVTSERTLLIKGLDLFFEVARLLPDVPFAVLGVHDSYVDALRRRYRPPENVQLVPPHPRETLPSAYGGASVYLQLSRTEGGLPMALGEAMLCGCIPVASRAGGMPDTVGEAGFIVDSPDPVAIAGVVRRALSLAADPNGGPAARCRARQRIVERFSRAQRAAQLLAVLDRIHAPSES